MPLPRPEFFKARTVFRNGHSEKDSSKHQTLYIGVHPGKGATPINWGVEQDLFSRRLEHSQRLRVMPSSKGCFIRTRSHSCRRVHLTHLPPQQTEETPSPAQQGRCRMSLWRVESNPSWGTSSHLKASPKPLSPLSVRFQGLFPDRHLHPLQIRPFSRHSPLARLLTLLGRRASKKTTETPRPQSLPQLWPRSLS